MNKTTYTLFLFLLLPVLLTAQRTFSFNQGYIKNDQFFQVIPFEYLMNKVIIEAEVNGHIGRYILDTGAMCIVFKDTSRQQDLEVIHQMNVNDANDKIRRTDIVKIGHIRLGELEYFGVPALYVEPFEGLLKCFGVDGLIGSNLLRFGAFRVDVSKRELTLANSYQDLGYKKKEGIKLSVNKIQSSPFVTVEMNGVKQRNVLVDTGSGEIYCFNERMSQKMQHKGALVQPAYISSGTNGQGAWGIDTLIKETKIWRIDWLNFAGSIYKNLLLRSDETSSRIGMELMEQGEFVLDYPKKRFFFNSHSEQPVRLSIESFGIDFVSINDSIRVNGLWSDTEACNIGISRGDILVDVKGFNFRETSLCDMFFRLRKESRDKQELEFILRRQSDGVEYKAKLRRIE